MNNPPVSDGRIGIETEPLDERRRFLKNLAVGVVVISSGLLFPSWALARGKGPRNITGDGSKGVDLPLSAYPSFRSESPKQKKCKTETSQYYHDASGTVRTITKTVCE